MEALTKIEMLGRSRPAIPEYVETMFERCKSLRTVRDALARDFGVKVSHEAVNHYRKKWDARQEVIRDAKRKRQALAELLAEQRRPSPALQLVARILDIECGQCG